MRPLTLFLCAMLLPAVRPLRAEQPPRLMTDSREYCAHLTSEMVKMGNRQAKPAPYVRDLADEGRRMCDRGQYRAGVARLRRALILMRSGQ
jgi:hypothetical protein